MTVEYHASTATNMDFEDSKIDYKRFFMDGGKLRSSVFVLRNSPYRVATVCLGLLCVLLLAVVIGQSVHHEKVQQDHHNNIKAMSIVNENLKEDLKSVQKAKRDIEANRKQLKQNYDTLSKRKDQIEANKNVMSEETNKLKLSQRQLETTNVELNKQIEQLRASKTHLDTSNNVLSAAKDLLQTQFNALLTRKNELQVNYDSVTMERDNLQNKFNNVTRSREKLQVSYNDLIKDVEHLQDRFNFSSSETDKLAGSHQNVTAERDALQANLDILKKASDKLLASYSSLAQEKEELESGYKNVTAERELLKVQFNNLTAEIDYLHGELGRLNVTMQDKKCLPGWKKFEYSCYYTSTTKKSWKQSREFCQAKGADLAIIKSKSEMDFINGLYGSDQEVWIGLTDDGIEGKWTWVDGTPLNLTFWGSGQPNSYNGRDQDCVEFWHRASGKGEWNDENCKLTQNWICEM